MRELEPARVYEACKRLLLTSAPVTVALRPGNGKADATARPSGTGKRAATRKAETAAPASRP